MGAGHTLVVIRRLSNAWFLFSLILLLAVALRFVALDRPSVWGDEAMSFFRVCGSYQQMLEELRTAGFMPLHYQLLWWIREGFPLWGHVTDAGFEPSVRLVSAGIPLAPFALRFVPAACGVIGVAGMYMLVAQLFGRRVGLVAALVAATSAYLLVYSRDAKMYMQFWGFAILHVACFVWWLKPKPPANTKEIDSLETDANDGHPEQREGSGPIELAENPPGQLRRTARHDKSLKFIAWLAWLASGVTMIAFNALGGFVLAIEIIWAISLIRLRRPTKSFLIRSTLTVLGLIVGTGIIAAVPAVYYGTFNRFDDRVAPTGSEGQLDVGDAGVWWVQAYNRGREGPDYALYTASSYLFSWEWPRERDLADVPTDVLTWKKAATISLIALAALGLIPGKRIAAWAIDRIAKSPHKPEPLTKLSGVWLMTLWLCVPCYLFYVLSVRGASSPDELILRPIVKQLPTASLEPVQAHFYRVGRAIFESETVPAFPAEAFDAHLKSVFETMSFSNIRWGWLALIVGVVAAQVLLPGVRWRDRFARLGCMAAMGVALFAVLWVVFLVVPAQQASVWMPRYSGFVWPAFATLLVLLYLRLPTVGLRIAAVLLLVGVNVANFSWRVWGDTEPPTGLMARDAIAAKDDSTRLVFGRPLLGGGAPGQGGIRSMPMQYYLATITRDAVSPGDLSYREFRYLNRFRIESIRARAIESWVKSRLDRAAGVEHAVLWIEFSPEDANDSLDIAAIGPNWRLISDESFDVNDHWMHTRMSTWRRVEIEKNEEVRIQNEELTSDQP